MIFLQGVFIVVAAESQECFRANEAYVEQVGGGPEGRHTSEPPYCPVSASRSKLEPIVTLVEDDSVIV